MKVGVLGPLEVSSAGRPVVVGAPKERALLSLLATCAGTAVGFGSLVDALWGEDAPRSARKIVQVYVSNLRRLLPPGSIVTVPDGYCLRVPADDVDASRFRRLAAEGRAAIATDPVAAVATLRAAIGLWRGPALVELVDHPAGRAEAASLDETRRTCEEALADARLRAGDHVAAVADLEAAVAAEPLREQRWEQLITALYRSGRRTDALRAYQSVRALLAEEIGLEPGTALKALEEAIILEKPELDGPPRGAGTGRAAPARHGAVLPLPAVLAAGPASGVVGRTGELTWMAERVARAAAGAGLQVLLVSGEPGIGKTTLVAEAARAAFAAGACVLYGQCQEDLRAPYQLFAEALGHLVANADEGCLREHVAEHGPELARIVPALRARLGCLPPPQSADPDTERYLLFAAIAGLLATVAGARPAVLVLDDLQWADVGSLQLLRHLVRVGPGAGAVVLATYRAGDPSVAPAFGSTLADLYRHRATTHIELAGLDDRGVASLLRAIAGEDLSTGGAALAAAVHRETDGNPFFVSETFRHLAETGAISKDAAGRWAAGEHLELPESIRVVIKARVARLGAGAAEALSLAAVVGRGFDLDVLVHASGIAEEALIDVLERAREAALVREVAGAPGRYAFAHALVQRTLYDDLGGPRRARAHRLVAEGLERLREEGADTRLGELAWHWSAAARTPALARKALDYARRAGDAALAALSPDDALRRFEQATELLARAGDPDPIVAIDLAIGLGTAQHQTGDRAYRETLLRAARQAHALGDTDRLVAALLANERDLLSADVDDEKVALLEEALAAVPAPSTERAMLLASLHRELLFAQPRGRCGELAGEALEIAAETRDDATIAAVINRVSLPTPLMFERSLELSAEAVVRSQRTGDPVLLFWASLRRAKVAATAGDLQELDRCLARCGRLAARLCQPVLSFACTMERSGRALLVGDADLAEQLAAEALGSAEEHGLAGTEIGSAASAMTVSWYRGRLGELADVVEKAIAVHPGVTAFRAVLALAYAEARERAAAGSLIEEFVRSGFELVPNPLWLIETMGYAAAALEAEDARFAAALHEQLVPWAAQFSYYNPATFGPVSHVLGGLAALLGRHEEAEEHFARSAGVCEAMRARFFAARTDLAWGTTLARRGAGAGRARQLLARAHGTAAAGGYAKLAERAAGELAAL